MIAFRPKTFVLVVTAILAGTAGARAQNDWLVFYPITGEVMLGYDGDWTRSNGTRTLSQIEYEERLRLNFGGYSLDPRIFNFNLYLEPVLTQTDNSSATGGEDSDSTFLNYSARFSLLHGAPRSPVSLAGSFTGSSDEVDGSLGTRREITTTTRGADLHWKFRPFPSTLSYLDRSLDETFISPFSAPVDREEFQQTVRYRGRSSKMEVFLEGIEFDDRTAANQDYESQEGRLSNFWRWGKGSGFTSRLTYLTREGFNAYDRTTVDESLRLQHLENLYTNYAYSYELQERTVTSEKHRGDFDLNHRLYSNLTTSFRLNASKTEAEQFRDEIYEGNLDFYYTKQIRPGVRVNANLGGGYKVSDQFSGRIDFSETQTVDITGVVVLTQRFIIQSTIVVTAPGCSPCTEGPDYLVQSAGGDFTQLSIPGGSRINIGDTIGVDYTYEPPTAKYYSIPYRVGFRLDYRWASVYHRTGGESQHFISGPDPDAVGDQRSDTTGVEFRWTRDTTRLTASAERRFTTNINRESTEYVFRQTAHHNFAPNLAVSGNLSESFIYDDNDVAAYNADATVNWFPVRGLSVSPFLSAFYRTTEPSTEERFWRAGVNTRWNWRRLDMELRYDHTDHETDTSSRVEDRLMMTVRRRF